MGDLVDMEMSDDLQLDHPMPIAMEQRARYPYGLRLCLCDEELKKLGLAANCDTGDYVDIRAFGTVTSVHKEGDSSRVEIQIERMCIENETNEGGDDD